MSAAPWSVAGASIEQLGRTAEQTIDAAKDRQAFDADLGNWVVAGHYEVAALPAAAARPWTESVTAALVEAAAEMVCPAADSAGQLQALTGSMRCIALTMCSYWGQDPLPLKVIENSARIVSVHQASSARLHQFLEF